MRITGGQARGIPIHLPKGDSVRPATDAMRQSVFSSLAARIEGAVFLDLFAGSGSYGLEAISRGAAGGTFVEKNAKTAAFIRQNLTAVCKSVGRTEAGVYVINTDAGKLILPPGATLPDLVFVDPPYEIIREVGPKIFAQMDVLLASKADPVVMFEMPGEIELKPVGWTCVKRLGKGSQQPTANFFRANRALLSPT
ncbi:RsmD family RNA methyltransferase [Oleiharenicola lentus]|uniref:RsmD family RNA methyltransferase n=1 Tax=Oleiharenicola lentus TaxID=2508720 RepID=UPI003F670270